MLCIVFFFLGSINSTLRNGRLIISNANVTQSPYIQSSVDPPFDITSPLLPGVMAQPLVLSVFQSVNHIVQRQLQWFAAFPERYVDILLKTG